MSELNPSHSLEEHASFQSTSNPAHPSGKFIPGFSNVHPNGLSWEALRWKSELHSQAGTQLKLSCPGTQVLLQHWREELGWIGSKYIVSMYELKK